MKLQLNIILFLLSIGLNSNAQYKTEIYVAKDDSGDFESIQLAIDNAKSFPDKRITIFIKNGIYNEKIKVHSWNNRITLKGENADSTIIQWDDYFDKIDRGRNSTFHTATLLVQGDEFSAENLTIENTAGKVGQAIALAVEADRCSFQNCKIKGNQDTLFTSGTNSRQYFQNCYIEGTTDFIFGGATVLFENCTIQSKGNSYITAASTPAGKPFGFVFLKCTLTAAPGIDSVYLGRPWRSFAKTAFIHCEMGDHILPEGWDNWSDPEKEITTFYAEFKNTGPGANASKRVSWSHQLSKKQAKKYYAENILKPVLPPAMEMDFNSN